MYGQISAPDEAEMLMRSESMPEVLRVAAFGPMRKNLFCPSTIEPRRKPGTIMNIVEAVEGFDKNIPGQVLRGDYISGDAQAQGINLPGMGVKESKKRLSLACLRALHKCGSQNCYLPPFFKPP
ncbi:MAG: hypothetical protein WA637_15600 [Terriglobales bacterium]